jgi:hypothetical protein
MVKWARFRATSIKGGGEGSTSSAANELQSFMLQLVTSRPSRHIKKSREYDATKVADSTDYVSRPDAMIGEQGDLWEGCLTEVMRGEEETCLASATGYN